MPLKSMPCGKPLFCPSKQYITTAFYSFVGTAVKRLLKMDLELDIKHVRYHEAVRSGSFALSQSARGRDFNKRLSDAVDGVVKQLAHQA